MALVASLSIMSPTAMGWRPLSGLCDGVSLLAYSSAWPGAVPPVATSSVVLRLVFPWGVTCKATADDYVIIVGYYESASNCITLSSLILNDLSLLIEVNRDVLVK